MRFVRALNYFWGHLQMFNFSEIVPIEMCIVAIQRIMKESCIAYDIVITLLDIRVWEEDSASQDKNFSEIWVLDAL